VTVAPTATVSGPENATVGAVPPLWHSLQDLPCLPEWPVSPNALAWALAASPNAASTTVVIAHVRPRLPISHSSASSEPGKFPFSDESI
jgi:hypothetical protein